MRPLLPHVQIRARSRPVTAYDGATDEDVTAAVVDVIGARATVQTASQVAQQSHDELSGTRQFFTVLFAAFCTISLAVAALIILNTFLMVSVQHTGETRLLRVVGLTGKQTWMMVLSEAATVGAIGSVVGLLIDNTLVAFGKHLLSSYTGHTLSAPRVPSTAMWFVALVVLPLLSALAAVAPALLASLATPFKGPPLVAAGR